MGRETEEATKVARQRLEMLGQELGRSGVLPRATQPDLRNTTAPIETPSPSVPEPSGRHSRRKRPPWSQRAEGWLIDRVPSTLRGRISLGHGAMAILGLLGLGALLLGWIGLTNSSEPAEKVPSVSREPVVQGTALPSVEVESANGAAPSSEIVIDIAGKVRNPGVFTLPAGSRVIDAIEAAGGVRPGAKSGDLNRARVLVDGEQIYVGKPPGGVAAAAASSPGTPAGSSLVPLNSATQEQLETLPGVGPVTAQSILAWRSSHGAFTSVDELLEIDGIGEKTLAKLAPLVTL